MCEAAHGEQKRESLPLELELQTVVSYLVQVLGTELRIIEKSSKHS